jgi:hypothetical protein
MEIPSVETLGYCHRNQINEPRVSDGDSSLIKHSVVKIPTVRAKNCCELIAKRALPVVLCLIANIRCRRLNSGYADAECSVALLPGEASQSRKCFVIHLEELPLRSWIALETESVPGRETKTWT